ncbi:MAG: hypothetical protein ACK4ON_07885, partial [Bacteroidia bacterium]
MFESLSKLLKPKIVSFDKENVFSEPLKSIKEYHNTIENIINKIKANPNYELNVEQLYDFEFLVGKKGDAFSHIKNIKEYSERMSNADEVMPSASGVGPHKKDEYVHYKITKKQDYEKEKNEYIKLIIEKVDEA